MSAPIPRPHQAVRVKHRIGCVNAQGLVISRREEEIHRLLQYCAKLSQDLDDYSFALMGTGLLAVLSTALLANDGPS